MPTVTIMVKELGRGYWLADEEARRRDDLPIDETLRAQLQAWNHRWEDECDCLAYDDLRGSRFDFVAFSIEGHALACAVKRSLPHWTVLYWDEAMEWRQAREFRRFDQRLIEFEITLEEAQRTKPPAATGS